MQTLNTMCITFSTGPAEGRGGGGAAVGFLLCSAEERSKPNTATLNNKEHTSKLMEATLRTGEEGEIII